MLFRREVGLSIKDKIMRNLATKIRNRVNDLILVLVRAVQCSEDLYQWIVDNLLIHRIIEVI